MFRVPMEWIHVLVVVGVIFGLRLILPGSG